MKQKGMLFWTVMIIISLSIVSAEFEVEDDLSDIENLYFSGEVVRGFVAMSFDDQPNAAFHAEFEGDDVLENATLLSVLEAMNLARGTSYTCEPASCKDHFTVSGTGDREKTFDLVEDEETYYGFRIFGDPVNLDDSQAEFFFNISSDAGPSCGNQVLFDMFDDGSIDFYNLERTNVQCALDESFFGCFNEDEWTGEEAILDGGTPYCQKIEILPPAAGYSLEAQLRVIEPDFQDRITFSIHDLENNRVEECVLDPIGTVETQFTSVSCVANYSTVRPIEVFVCVEQSAGQGEYAIKTENLRPCGGNLPSSSDSFTPTNDFDLKALPMQYASFGSQFVNVASYAEVKGQGVDLVEEVGRYISEVYENNCSDAGGGCVIPFSIEGIEGQSITLNNGRVKYREGSGGILTSVNNFYKLEKSDFTISANTTLLDVSKMGFTVPQSEDDQLFELFFDGESVIDATIQVDIGFDFFIGPEFALIGQDTVFTAFTTDNSTISSTLWDFGDGTPSVSAQGGQVSHRYRNESEYTVEVKATNADGDQSTKQFRVLVGEAEQSLNQTIISYRKRISDVQSQLDSLDSLIRDDISTTLDIDSLESDVLSIQNRYGQLGGGKESEEYMPLLEEILALEVPYSVSAVESGTVPGDVGYNSIDTRHVKDLSGSDGDSAEIKNGIISWMNDNYQLEITYETYVASFDRREETLLTFYEVRITQLSSSPEDATFIINYPEERIVFDDIDYNPQPVSEGSGTYIDIYYDEYPDIVQFYIEGEQAPKASSLGMHISPDISDLPGNIGPITPIPEGGFNWTRFIFGMIIVFMIILTLYVILQSWYKRYYERHLFKNPDHLYNIINFIYNSRKNGLMDSETRKALLQRKWTGEQVSYAFKKIDGKRTGMWEIPLFKFIENKKVKKELEKKQGGHVDARFIKRPSFH